MHVYIIQFCIKCVFASTVHEHDENILDGFSFLFAFCFGWVSTKESKTRTLRGLFHNDRSHQSTGDDKREPVSVHSCGTTLVLPVALQNASYQNDGPSFGRKQQREAHNNEESTKTTRNAADSFRLSDYPTPLNSRK